MTRRVLAVGVLGAGVLLFKHDTLFDPYHWDGLGGVAAPALDALDHGFRLIHPDGLNFGHPPLLHLGLALLWRLFGTSLPVAHLLALAAATATLAFTAAIAQRAFGPRAAIAAVVITFSHTLFFAQSGTVNDSMPLAALSMGVFWASLERRWLAFGLLSGALVLTKETGALVVALLCGATLLGLLQRRERPDAPTLRMLGGAGLAFLLLAGWYLYQHHVLGLGLRTELVGLVPRERWPGLLVAHLVRDTSPAQTNGFNGVLVLAGLIGLRGLDRAQRRVVLAALALFLAHVVLFLLTVDVPRYHAPTIPFLALAASAVFQGELRAATPRLVAEVVALSTWVLACAGGLHTQRVAPGFLLESTLDYRDQLRADREAAAWLEQHAGSELVLATWPLTWALAEPRHGYVRSPVRVRPSGGGEPGLYLLSDQALELQREQLPLPVEVLFEARVNGRRAQVLRAGSDGLPPSVPGLVAAVARGLLGRDPTDSERGPLQVAAQRSPQALVRAVLATEAWRRSSRSPAEVAESLYVSLLGRAPDVEGREATLSALTTGRTEERVLDMISSEECQRRQR